MARAQATDFLQNFRFQVMTTDGKLGAKNGRADNYPMAGFSACTIPSISVETGAYREGIWTYTKKQPGVPTIETCELSRGVCRKETELYKWILDGIKGRDYRCTVVIGQYHRDNDKTPARRVVLHEAWAQAHKPAGDLDGTSSEINISTLTIECEFFDIVVDGVKMEG